jgi:hypothetical protein
LKTATLDDLLVADDPIECEAPAGFDRLATLARIRPLLPELEHLTGLPFKIDEQIQDASFFAELSATDPTERPLPSGSRCIETFIGVRFSAFANLFTIWTCSSVRPLTDDERVQIAELISSAGFLYVPAELLESPYTGNNWHLQHLRNWWLRFFDYL